MSDTRFWTSLAVAAVTAGVGVAFGPWILLAVPAAGAAIYLLLRPGGRLVWFILGALLVFQSGDGLTASKLGYLAGVTLATGLALARLPRLMREQPWVARLRPAFFGVLLLAVWIVVVTPLYSIVALGIAPSAWARDAITYLLVCTAVVIGLDAATSLTLRAARLITASTGAFAAYAFASYWIQRRASLRSDVAEIAQTLLASFVALSVPVALALTLAVVGRGVRWWWLGYATVLIGAVLLTGTRSGLVFAAALVGVVGASGKARAPLGKVVVAAAASVAALAVVLPLLAALVAPRGVLEGRFAEAVSALTGGLGQDQSASVRSRAYRYAGEVFNTNPLMGQGVGNVFPDPNVARAAGNFTSDTPLVYLAKFGLVGTLVLAAALVLVVWSLLRARPSVELTVARATVAVWLAYLPFSPTTEDKGFALSVALLVVLVGASMRPTTTEAATPVASLSRSR